ncbi:Retinitis pigmentosa 9 protein [Tyrophagus putrescentiae]|nr:Retinitis pigmentosa 9 protein [Tyrophagus putrescentiae]
MSGSKDHRPSGSGGGSGGKSSNSNNSNSVDGQLLDALKHYDSFYEKPPPGLIKSGDEEEERPEDVIPDTPANSAARDFLAKAPTKGLWMPLGKEVKVMKCWRCKNYGHRTGDKECPLFLSGNKEAEEFRHLHEDPMYNYVRESEIRAKAEKVEMLKRMLESSKDEKKKKKRKKKWKKKMKKKGEKEKKRLKKR